MSGCRTPGLDRRGRRTPQSLLRKQTLPSRTQIGTLLSWKNSTVSSRMLLRDKQRCNEGIHRSRRSDRVVCGGVHGGPERLDVHPRVSRHRVRSVRIRRNLAVAIPSEHYD